MVFEYSFWWIFPAIVWAIAVAYFKYKKLSRLPDIPSGIVWLIAGLRFIIIFSLLLLLLNPALSLLHQIKEKPLLIVAQDNSASLLKNKDSLYYQNEYRASLDRAVGLLENKFEIVRVTFGSEVRKDHPVDFTENRTDIAAVMDYTARNFLTRQPEGMVLLSDGIYNGGVNPRYKVPAYPVYTVALGDTTCYPDVYVRNLEADKFNFLHTLFPVKAEIAALREKGQTVKCVLRENGNRIDEKLLKIDQDNFISDVVFQVEAKKKGIIRYSIELETGFKERSHENNKAETWINIIDNSADIAVFTHAPHPDIAAIMNAVNVSGIYQCREHQFTESFDTLKANLIILHNPRPADPGYQKLLQEARRRKIALWYILTERKNISEFASVNKHYSVNFTTERNEYASVGVNAEFPYFEFTPEEKEGFKTFPPLIVPFGEINTGAGRILFNQTIKNILTPHGMLGFYEWEGERLCYLWGEGLWRWRLFAYQENGNHELFNTLINKIIGYLSAQKGNERFIHDIKPVYGEMEEALIHAELYNDSYELVNSPEVKLELKYKDKVFDYMLPRYRDKYRMNLGNLLAGEYTYRLSTNYKGEAFEKKGTFYVRNHNSEINDVVANRHLLKEIAETSGGRMFAPQDLEHLVQILKDNDQLKPVFRIETEFMELNRMSVLGLILLLLLCTEWFLLKIFAG